MIKGVLFDYGGVIADGGRGIEIAQRLIPVLDIPESAVDELLTPLFAKFVRGTIDDAAFWSAIENGIGHSVSEEERHAWDTWWGLRPYPEMLEVISKLKIAGIPVGLLSNIFPPTRARIASEGGYDGFDFTVLSCDVGYAKPDPEIYDLAMSHFEGLKPEEIVFVDDQEKCMPPAQALGMKTILATSSDQVIAELKALGLPV